MAKLTKKDKFDRLMLIIIEEYAFDPDRGFLPLLDVVQLVGMKHMPMKYNMQIRIDNPCKIEIRLLPYDKINHSNPEL